MNISRQLSQYIFDTDYEDLDLPTINATRKSLLDALGVTLAASGLCDACRSFVGLAAETGGKAQSRILGFRTKTTPALAAFANGAMAHALDFEDAHDRALVHPNAAAIPAALAVAESLETVNGRQFIAALAAACDLVCRLGLAFTKNPIEYGWYPPPILGAFGAAAAAGKLLGLNPAQLCDAFSLTLCQATCSAELRFSPYSDLRAVRDAFAAHAGVVSAQLALRGVRGFEAPFEGRAGLYHLYAAGHYEPSRLTADLGRRFEGADLSFKPWPACRGTHAFIEAALLILAKHPIDPQEIVQVRATISPLNRMLCEPPASKQRPVTAIDAKFSLPFVVATALLKGRVLLDDFLPRDLNDQAVLDLAAKITYEVDDSLELVDATRGALEITTSKGRFRQQVDIPLGHPDHPISNEALEEKFINCAAKAHLVPAEKGLREMIDRIWALEKIEDMGTLTGDL